MSKLIFQYTNGKPWKATGIQRYLITDKLVEYTRLCPRTGIKMTYEVPTVDLLTLDYQENYGDGNTTCETTVFKPRLLAKIKAENAAIVKAAPFTDADAIKMSRVFETPASQVA